MIEQNVQVLRFQDERLWVQLGSQTGCRACDDGEGCGAGVFAKLFQRKPVVLELPRNQVALKTGQILTLALPEQLYVKLVLMAYAWPLLALLAGGLAGHSLATWFGLSPFLTDMSALLTGLFGAVIVLRLIRQRQRQGLLNDSLHLVDYYPATGNKMCGGSRLVSTNENR